MAAPQGGADGFVAEIMKIPPVTRFLCGSVLAVTGPVLMKLVQPYSVLFVREYITRRWEVWRIYTSFFYGGGSAFNLLFDMVMLYRNSDELETQVFGGRSADFGWQLLLTSSLILALNLPFRSFLHFRALLVSTAYLLSRVNPHGVVSLFGLISLQNQYFPYAMVAMDFVSGGGMQAAVGAFTGIVAGHVWWMMTGAGNAAAASPVATAPTWWRKLIFREGARPAPSGGAPVGASSSGVRVFPPREQQAAQQQGNATGYNWGRGQRLGS